MIKTCIIFGGVSSEHEVSLRSATSVLRNIDKNKYEVHMLGITTEGRWLYYTGDAADIESGQWEHSGKTTPAVISPDRAHRGLLFQNGEVIPLSVVFPVLHGKNGEDGTIQGLLELSGIPYVGCGMLASAACMDKEVTHHLLVAAGIPRTKLIALKKHDTLDFDTLESTLGYPMFIKPANAGSSVGVTKVSARSEIQPALDKAFAHDDKLVAEAGVIGREVECAVMGNNAPIVSQTIGEIILPSDGFYDYSAKYLDDTAGLIIPADIDPDTAQHIRETAVAAYLATGCKGFSRVDFFLKPDGEIMINEINTIPGFTSISMFPKLFIQSGIEYSEIIDKLISYAME